MPRILLHGVQLSWSCEGEATEALAELLRGLGPADPAEESNSGVVITLRTATATAAKDPRDAGYSPAFFQGGVQAYRGGSGAGESFLLWDRASKVRVSLTGSPIAIDALIAPADREPLPGSAAGMLHIALAIALRREGLFHLHAAALVHPQHRTHPSRPGAAVLVAGGSGAGKTTTAIALIEAGYAYLGDDALFLRNARDTQNHAGPELLAFPREFHVGPATLRAFPRLAPLARPRAGHAQKLAIDPREAFPGRERRSSPCPAVALFPSIADAARTDMTQLSRAEALGYLLASSAAILIDGAPRRDENIAVLRAIVEAASCHEIRLGRDVLEDPTAAIAPHLERVLGKC